MKKHLPVILALLIVAAILMPDIMPGPGNEPAAAQPQTQVKPQKTTIVAWRERPLFHRSRKPFVSAAGTDAAMPPAGGAGDFGERFEVKGFGRANGTVLAILVDKTSEEAHRVSLGEEIEGWVFASENDGAVTFTGAGGKSVTLTLARLP